MSADTPSNKELNYSGFTPAHMRFLFCPLCANSLIETRDLDNHMRPRCPQCGWIHYPTNLMGSVVVISTPEGLVFILPPDEPPETPAAFPAGIAEFGESPEEAAVREAREETGLEVKLTGELGRLFWQSPLGPMLSFLYEARIAGGAPQDGPEGKVAIYPMDRLPRVSPNRKGSLRALALYLEKMERTEKSL